MTITYRPIKPDEFEGFFLSEARAYSQRRDPGEVEHYRPVFEFDRSLAAFEPSTGSGRGADTIVGGAGSFQLDMTVPGGVVPTAIISWVSVQPTHRRRGILSELMSRQLRDIHGRGESLAALHASESVIYGRFGYGLGSQKTSWTIDRAHTAFASAVGATGRIRLLEIGEAKRLMPGVYERVRPERPGMLARDDKWWRFWFWDSESEESGGSKRLFAVYENDGTVGGYAIYRLRSNWQGDVSKSTLFVVELIAVTREAHAALWRYCFDIDLVDRIRALNQPLDDPIVWMLANPRRLERSQGDALWVRVIDVPRALSCRRYSRDGRIVLEVADSICSWNDGRYRLEGGPEQAECVRTDEPADISLSVADLGAIYLGGVRPSVLAQAGRVSELKSGGLSVADAMFAWPLQPWCPAFDPVT